MFAAHKMLAVVTVLVAILSGSAAMAQPQKMMLLPPGHGPGPGASSVPKLGFHGSMVHGWGLRVNDVHWGGIASRLGLESGDVLTRINGRAIQSNHDYFSALQDAAFYNGGHVTMTVDNIRGRQPWSGVPRFVTVHFNLYGGDVHGYNNGGPMHHMSGGGVGPNIQYFKKSAP